MKKTWLSLLSITMLFSCQIDPGQESFSVSDSIQVIFAQGDTYSLVQYAYDVSRGDSLTVHIDFIDGYQFDTCSYGNFTYETDTDGDADLTLLDLCFSTTVIIDSKPIRKRDPEIEDPIEDIDVDPEPLVYDVDYYPNGGTLLSDSDKSQCYSSVTYTLEHHLRPNTPIGTDIISRTGYVQVGWNTSEDGSGSHVGLGSRFTPECEHVSLYAEWVKYTSLGNFTYTKADEGYKITGYSGDLSGDVLCIPGKIATSEVTEIGENVFKGIDFDRVIIPSSVIRIGKKAFSEFNIGQLTFFDNLKYVSDESFDDETIEKLDIQAHEKPTFIGDNDNSEFSEDVDRLILAKGKKKMVFFAGCSMSYGLKSSLIASEFPDYQILNMGVIGGTTASFQFEIIHEFMEEGDVFVHAPEEMSPYQLMHDLSAEMRIFILTEANYDLLHYASFSECTGLFDSYKEFHDLKDNLVSQTYDYYNSHYDEYGDICIERPNGDDDAYFQTETCFDTTLLDEVTERNLNSVYETFEDKGIDVYFSYAPINANAVKNEENGYTSAATYASFMNSKLEHAQVISAVSDYIMEGKYFYDRDYHLSDEGAKIRTENLIDDLKPYLQNE